MSSILERPTMSPTRRNCGSALRFRTNSQAFRVFSIPRLERLEDRWNPAGVAQLLFSGPVHAIEPTTAVSEIAIVDSELLALVPAVELRGSKVIAIDGNSDPIRQIDKALEGLADISVLRIISHGASGAFWLGGERIDTETLQERTSELRSWGRALTADADLLLYGCSVAAGEVGLQFLRTLSISTGADVAASSNTTGMGGDAILEKSVGVVEHGLKSVAEDWSAAGLSLTFTSLDRATFYAERGNSFTVHSDLASMVQYRLASGQLPTGIQLEVSTGILWGTPSAESVGTYSLRIQAIAGTQSAFLDFTLDVKVAPVANEIKNNYAFAALSADGTITAWGDKAYGGSGFPTDKGYTGIYSAHASFAALKYDGSIASWGLFPDAQPPKDSGYIKIIELGDAFVAIKKDGSFKLWGYNTEPYLYPITEGTGYTDFASASGSISILGQDGTIYCWGLARDILKGNDFVKLYSNGLAFSALRKDGSIASWGGSAADPQPPSDGGYIRITPLGRSFAAFKADGSIATWGEGAGIPPTDNGYITVVNDGWTWAALKNTGEITAWTSFPGGHIDSPSGADFISLVASANSFSALRKDGSIFSFLHPDYTDVAAPNDSGFTRIVENHGAFIGIRSDGSLSGWGRSFYGKTNVPQGSGFVDVIGVYNGFLGLKTDGSIVAWGSLGNDIGTPTRNGFIQVVNDVGSFAALNQDGSVSIWGNPDVDGKGRTIPGRFMSLADPQGQTPVFPLNTDSKLYAIAGSPVDYRIPVFSNPFPTFSVTKGALPDGVTLDSQTGMLSGTPKSPGGGPISFTIQLANIHGKVSKDFSLEFAELHLSDFNAQFTVGSFGNFQFPKNLSGAGLRWSFVAANPIPDGLIFHQNDGTISGTPAVGAGGSYQFAVTPTNLVNRVSAQALRMVIAEAPAFLSLPNATFTQGKGNTFLIETVGYPKPTLAIKEGSLPEGVFFDPITGVIRGYSAKSAIGSHRITLSLTNDNLVETRQDFTLEIKRDDSMDSAFAPNESSFAALRKDGSIAAWGSESTGGTGAPKEKGFVQIYSNFFEFAGLRSDGSIATWGYKSPDYQLYTQPPKDRGYIKIISNGRAFTAVKADGSLYSWGLIESGGVGAPQGAGFIKILPNYEGFIALNQDGTVSVWGKGFQSSPQAADDGGKFLTIVAGDSTFLAIDNLGYLYYLYYYGKEKVEDPGVIDAISLLYFDIALKRDGSIAVINRGGPNVSGDFTGNIWTTYIKTSIGVIFRNSLGNYKIFSKGQLYPIDFAGSEIIGERDSKIFIKKLDGLVYSFDGQTETLIPDSAGIEKIVSNAYYSFALKNDGSIDFIKDGFTTPDSLFGSFPKDKNNLAIFSTSVSFAALRKDGSVASWGFYTTGKQTAPKEKNFVSLANPGEQPTWVTSQYTPKIKGQLGQSLSIVIPIRGIPAPLFTLVKGTLPEGVVLDPQTGMLLGKPTKLGTFAFTISASNGIGNLSQVDFSLQIGQAINDPPVGADKTIGLVEDQVYPLKESDFGFRDPADLPANGFASLIVSALPAKGRLTLGGKPVVLNQEIPVAAIRAGKFQYIPVKNASGLSYASFSFRLRDSGGTKNGGNDLAPYPNTIRFDVTEVKDAPSGKDATFTISEDHSYRLRDTDFGFTDTSDTPANAFQSVVITAVPAKGSLTYLGQSIQSNQEIPVWWLWSGNVIFTPAPHASGTAYASISFKVRDDGNTENGGANLDPTSKKIVWNVLSVNDAPMGTDKAITLVEDKAYKFTAAGFKLADPDDTPANALASIQIVSLPERGTLTLGGKVVKAGQEIFVQDITAGKLAFVPPPDANGQDFSGFAFKTRDNGGTARGGVNLAIDSNRITFHVVPVNDPPTGVNQRLTVTKTAPFVFSLDQFVIGDAKDLPANALNRVQFTVVPAPGKGTLSLNGVALKANAFISVADIVAGKLKYVLPSTAKGKAFATISFKVEDDGGTANDGKNLALAANVFTIDVV